MRRLSIPLGRRVLPALATVAAVGLAAALHGRSGPGAPPDVPATPEAPATTTRPIAPGAPRAARAATAAAEPTAPRALGAGDVLAYDARAWFRIEAQPESRDLGDGLVARSAALQGDLEVRVLGREAGGIWLHAAFVSPSLSLALGDEIVSVPPDALEGLRRGVLVRLDSPGSRIVAARFDAGLGAEERNVFRSVLGWLFLPGAALPSGGLVTEEDPTGRFQADYRSRPDGRSIAFARTKLAYETTWAAPGQEQPPRVDSVESLLEGAFDPGREIVVSARIQERIEYRPEADFRWMRSEATGRLELREAGHDPDLAARARDRLLELRASTVEGSPVRPEVEDRPGETRPRLPAALAGVPVEGLLERLEALAHGDRFSSAETFEVFMALVWHLDREPELARTLALWIDGRARPPEVRAALVTALGAAGTAEAQEILAGLLDDAAEPAIREAAIFSTHQVRSPGARLESSLRDLARGTGDDASFALFALGTMLGKVRSGGRRGRELAGFLRDVARDSADPRLSAVAIEALGNARSDAIVPDLVRASSPDRPAADRQAAARALANLGTPRARESLRELAGDADPGVRAVALSALEGEAPR